MCIIPATQEEFEATLGHIKRLNIKKQEEGLFLEFVYDFKPLEIEPSYARTL
jgi:hypothetical protein